MMLCDISVVFNSFADAFGLMSRKRSSESRQALVSFQSTESFGRFPYAGDGPLMREYLVEPAARLSPATAPLKTVFIGARLKQMWR
jgi:hypothetical protein